LASLSVEKVTLEAVETCRSMWSHSVDVSTYDRYVGCVKCVLGGRRVFPEIGVEIRRRGHFYVRDFFVSSLGDGPHVDNIGAVGKHDVMFHGWKDSPVGVWWKHDTNSKCTLQLNQTGINESSNEHVHEWSPSLLPTVLANEMQLKYLVSERSRVVLAHRPYSLGIEDTKDCWPNCPENLTGEQTTQLRRKVCPDVLKKFYNVA
jgi:hypothetical protein